MPDNSEATAGLRASTSSANNVMHEPQNTHTHAHAHPQPLSAQPPAKGKSRLRSILQKLGGSTAHGKDRDKAKPHGQAHAGSDGVMANNNNGSGSTNGAVSSITGASRIQSGQRKQPSRQQAANIVDAPSPPAPSNQARFEASPSSAIANGYNRQQQSDAAKKDQSKSSITSPALNKQQQVVSPLATASQSQEQGHVHPERLGSGNLSAYSNPRDYSNDDDCGSGSGADPDASIRPITPSSIDASSSFTGSASLHSQAPTSRTFKSFVTGHSKGSVSTRPAGALQSPSGALAPTLAGLASSSSTTAAPAAAPADATSQQAMMYFRRDSAAANASAKGKDRASGEGIRFDMQEGNRIATSVHEPDSAGEIRGRPASLQSSSAKNGEDGTVQVTPTSEATFEASYASRPPPPISIAKASPLRNSFTGALPVQSDRPGMSSSEGYADGEHAGASADDDVGERVDEDAHAGDDAHGDPMVDDASSIRRGQAAGRTGLLHSSASITFSNLPPSTPTGSSYHIPTSSIPPTSPLLPSSSSTYSNFQRAAAAAAAATVDTSNLNYPRHSAPNPKNNPRASSPPPDNASTLTLASSTGPSQSLYTNAHSRYTVDRTRSGGLSNEDASIRAIAPSRRDSDSSLGSRWSAAVLSNREISGPATTTTTALDGAGAGSSSGIGGAGAGASTGDGASFKRRTPSLRTVATTSSYYATQAIQQQQQQQPVEIKT